MLIMIQKSIAIIQDEFLNCLITGNRKGCSVIVRQYLGENPSIKDLYEQVMKVALYKVGQLWEENKISPVTEHLATAIVEMILNELYTELNVAESQNKRVVLACVENEFHQVGIKMVGDVFEMNGWDSYFIGTSVPLKDLINYLKEVKPNMLAISLSIYFNFQQLLKMISHLRHEFDNLNIVIGGQAFSRLNKSDVDELGDVRFFSNLYELDIYLKKINVEAYD